MQSALFFLTICALTLGACSDLDPVSSNEPTEPAAKRRISSIIWTSTPVAGRAESRIHPLGTDEAVQIRSLLSITGAASLGGALRNGVELAVRDFGDIHGRAVELGESMDSMCTPDGGRAGAEQISADRQVVGVIGTSCSAAAVAASPVLPR